MAEIDFERSADVVSVQQERQPPAYQLTAPSAGRLLARLATGDSVVAAVAAPWGAGKTTALHHIGEAARSAGCEVHHYVQTGARGRPPIALHRSPDDRPRRELAFTDSRDAVVLLADDLDRWSESSRDAFERIVSVIHTRPSIIVATMHVARLRDFNYVTERLSIRSLTAIEGRDLLWRRRGIHSPPAEWFTESEGNPGVLLAVASEAEAAVPSAWSVHALATLEFLESLPQSVRRAAEVAAIASSAHWDVLERFGARTGDFTAEHLEHLEALGIADVRADGRFRWRAPGLRRGIRIGLSPPDARRIAGQLADALGVDDDPKELASLLISAARGPDAELSSRLIDVGRRLDRDGHAAAAWRTFMAATDTADRLSTRCAAAVFAVDAAFGTSGAELAVRQLLGVLDPASPEARADLLSSHLRSAPWLASIPPIRSLADRTCDETLVGSRTPDGNLSRRFVLADLANASFRIEDRALARLRDAEYGRSGPPLADAVAGVVAVARGVADLPTVARLSAGAPPDDDQPDDDQPEVLALRCWALLASEQHAAAAASADRMRDLARRTNDESLYAATILVEAEVELRGGRPAQAAALLAGVVTPSRLAARGAMVLAALARAEAMLGDEPACRRHAAMAIGLAHRRGLQAVEMTARAAIGHLELSIGDPVRARTELGAASRMAVGLGIIEPAMTWIAGDLLDCLSHPGADGLELTTVIEACARHSSTAWTRGVIARSLGRRTGAASLFDEAVLEFSSIGARFEVARTRLDQARVAAVDGPTRSVAEPAREARDLLDRIGAKVWARSASELLRATGSSATPTPRTAPATPAVGPSVVTPNELSTVLTQAEYRVALAVGTGATNREAAAKLVIGVRTVDTHLRSIFRKLGIRSRVQLACLLVEQRVVRWGEEARPGPPVDPC